MDHISVTAWNFPSSSGCCTDAVAVAAAAAVPLADLGHPENLVSFACNSAATASTGSNCAGCWSWKVAVAAAVGHSSIGMIHPAASPGRSFSSSVAVEVQNFADFVGWWTLTWVRCSLVDSAGLVIRRSVGSAEAGSICDLLNLALTWWTL